MLRKARITDARSIHQLLIGYAREGLMLSRPLPEIYESIRDFYVITEGERVIGTVSLHVCWEDLAEVRSLAVAGDCERRGVGRKLVEACLEEARQLGLQKVFALTYQPGFFTKLGFREIEKSQLPNKIWGDCMKCAKFPECDEIALIIELQGPPPGEQKP